MRNIKDMMNTKSCLMAIFLASNLLLPASMAATPANQQAGFAALFEAAQARRVSQFDQLPIQPGDIVFLGDSITEGGLWSEHFPGLPVRNRGVGGDTTHGLLQRLDQVSAGKPAKVFLLIGTNDLAQGISITDITNNIEKIISTLQSSTPQTAIYLQSLLPRDSQHRDAIESINAQLKLRLSTKVHWINLYPLFLDRSDGSIRNDLSNDELHLLGRGYLLWQEAIQSKVNLTLPDNQTPFTQ